jgi:voltage-dependent potassium channel beta subunit
VPRRFLQPEASSRSGVIRKGVTMEYRRLGRSGLKVSVLSFGSWVTFGSQVDVELAKACLVAAREAGVNFFDNAESYAGGESERIMGQAIAELGWPRWSYVVSTKLFWGIHDAPNMRNTLNRKYLLQALDASLERFGLDYVDLVYCHRADPETPIEETVWAMSDMVDRGKALYWGTSEWSADEIRAAVGVAERHHLRAPVVEQPQYNLFHRSRVEVEYARVLEDVGIGLTTWSPLASGLLTGKYLEGIPAGSRAALPGYEWLASSLTDPSQNDKVRGLAALASELDCSLAQLSIAWCAANPHVSTVITGASGVGQVRENLGALEVLGRLDAAVLGRIDKIVA